MQRISLHESALELIRYALEIFFFPQRNIEVEMSTIKQVLGQGIYLFLFQEGKSRLPLSNAIMNVLHGPQPYSKVLIEVWE